MMLAVRIFSLTGEEAKPDPKVMCTCFSLPGILYETIYTLTSSPMKPHLFSPFHLIDYTNFIFKPLCITPPSIYFIFEHMSFHSYWFVVLWSLLSFLFLNFPSVSNIVWFPIFIISTVLVITAIHLQYTCINFQILISISITICVSYLFLLWGYIIIKISYE